MSRYPHLFSPGRIGSLEIRNRLMQSAMGTYFPEPGGYCGDDLIAYHEARAAGGVGLIITEAVAVGHPLGKAMANQLGISDDRFIPGLKRLTDAVHRHGARIAIQLHFAGINAGANMAEGLPIWVPSLPRPSTGGGFQEALFPEERALTQMAKVKSPVTFKVMEQEDIDQLIRWFADGAERAVQAGFDAIEVHGGHGYIISGFLSPAANRRTDGYGGPIENRARLMREILTAIRQRIGRDFPVWLKMDTMEFYVENGITVEDACVTARIAAAAGADAITASATHNYAVPRALFSSYLPHEPAKLLPYAEQLKRAVNIPVIAVGRIDPELADKAIAEGRMDFMAMGRKQLADPNYANALASGGREAVRPCIYCYTCFSQAMLSQPLRCSVNGDLGFEAKNLLAPAVRPKYVVVVGGGPGGMETARRLTLRGHRVTLLEASDQLGGTARIAAIAYAPNGDFVAWLQRQLAELKVDVRLKTWATAEMVHGLRPDAVVVATGAVRRAPDIPGKELPHVHDGLSLRALLLGEDEEGAADKVSRVQRLAMGAARAAGLTRSPQAVRQASKLWMPVGDRVVIVGGELVGLELAEFLHERGRKVTVIDDAPQFGKGLSPARRGVMLDEMPLSGIAFHPGAQGIRIAERTVHFTTLGDEESHELPADTVIIAKGAETNGDLYTALVQAGLNAQRVGDCKGVGYIVGAVRDAADVAAAI